jgi:hypothetical protein
MLKKVICCLAALIVLLGVSGCEFASRVQETSTAPASVRKLRDTELAKAWKMRQMEIDLEESATIMLTLKEGDKVDGLFYLVQGGDVDFSIAGTSTFYIAEPPDVTTASVTSDRFSFIATRGRARPIR